MKAVERQWKGSGKTVKCSEKAVDDGGWQRQTEAGRGVEHAWSLSLPARTNFCSSENCAVMASERFQVICITNPEVIWAIVLQGGLYLPQGL